MNLNEKREIKKNELLNKITERINEKGIDKFIREYKGISKKNSLIVIENCYEDFKKDIKCYPAYHPNMDNETSSLISTIDKNKNDITIFEIEDDDSEYEINFPLIPYSKFYIATNISEEIENELYQIGGFFVLDFNEEFLFVAYIWSRTIKDGWAINSFLCRKNGLIENFDEKKIDYEQIEIPNIAEITIKELKLIHNMASKKFQGVMKKLIYKINKKEYSKYKKYYYGNYIEKKIIYAYDVRAHKRHFWNDTGYFNIPKLSKEDLLSKGYGIDELVYRDWQLRKDVPYKIIGTFNVNEDKEKKEENKKIILLEKRIFKQEEKVLKILRDLFPDDFIKRHDRKMLKGLELDFFIRDLRLGFEYDGEQHFDKKLCEEVFKSDFGELVKRDKLKNKLCIKKGITLIRIKYDEPITKYHIKNKLKENGFYSQTKNSTQITSAF